MLRFLIIFIIAVALLLHNLPYLVRDQAVIWLLDNGATKAQLTALKINWFEGSVEVEGLQAEAEGKPPLALDTFSVDLDYALLSEKRILLSNIQLQGVDVGIREQKTHLWLGPIDLNALQSEKAPVAAQENEQSSQWSVGLKQLQLSSIDWYADIAGQKHHLQLKTGGLADLYLWDQNQPVSINLDGQLNGAPLLLESSSKPLPDEKSSELKVNLKNFPLHSVTALFLPTLRAHVDLDVTIKARSNFGSHESHISQSGSLRIRNFSFKQDGLQLKHKGVSWDGTVNVGLLDNELTALTTTGKLGVDDLSILQGGNQVELGDLVLNSKVSMKGLKQIAISDIGLDAKGLKLQQGNQTVSVDSLAVKGAAESQNLSEWQANLPHTVLAGLGVSASGERLISLGNLKLSGLSAQHTEQIKLSSVEASQLKVQGKGGVFTQWKKVGAEDIAFNQLSDLSINKLSLSDSKTRVLLSSKRALTDLDWLLARLAPTKKSNTEVKAKTGQQKTKPLRVKLNQLNLSGKNPIQIVDAGVKPVFKTQLDISRLNLRSLDTGSKGKTNFDLNAKSKFSTISAKGAIELFSGNYGGNWDAEIKGIELPQVSPYSLHYTGYYLQNGQLSLTTKGTIKGRKLDGSSDIHLNKLEVKASDGERSGEFDQKVSMPLGTAIAILQDNEGNIDLQIPLDGSLDDPQFGYQSVINKLAGKGLKNAALGYLTQALQPFGALISISQMVMDAQEQGSFITLQPVVFEPAKAVLSADSKQYMAKLAGMMSERKGMRLNICGNAVAADQPLIWAKLVEANKKKKEPLDVDILRLELEPKLQQLAEQRNDAVKGELSQKHAVDIERLFGCYPKVDLKSKDSPQVSLGL